MFVSRPETQGASTLQTMRLFRGWPVVLVSLLIGSHGFAQPAPSPLVPGDLTRPIFDTRTPVHDLHGEQKPSDTAVAEVEGRRITLGEFRDFIDGLPPQAGQEDFPLLYPRVVRQLIYRTALAIRAREAALDNDPVLRRRVQDATDQILANGWLHKYLDGKIAETSLLARYDRDIGSQPPPEEVRFRVYLAATEQQAKDTIAALRGGADFATLARASSKDPSAANGGDLGFLPWSAVVPELAGVAHGLAAGELAPVPMLTRFGWVVLRLEERRPGTRPAFAQVREKLLGVMEQEQAVTVAEEAMKTMVIRTYSLNGDEPPGDNTAPAGPAKQGNH